MFYEESLRTINAISSFCGTGRSTNSLAWKRWLLWNKWTLQWSKKTTTTTTTTTKNRRLLISKTSMVRLTGLALYANESFRRPLKWCAMRLYTYWEILTKSCVVNFDTQMSSSQSEEWTMVFTREKSDTFNQNRERCFFTCEKNDTSNQKPQTCVSFAPKIPPFLAAC